ncbi:hypothetical protein ABTL91_20175, partial [Acinetobacter baumannii]
RTPCQRRNPTLSVIVFPLRPTPRIGCAIAAPARAGNPADPAPARLAIIQDGKPQRACASPFRSRQLERKSL